MGGAISLLVDSPLTVLMHAMRGVDGETRRQIGQQTKLHGQPIWQEETRGRVRTRMQARLAQSAKTSVTARQITLMAGGTGKLGSTPLSVLFKPIEFGGAPDRVIETRSRNGIHYKRRMGSGFGYPRRNGNVAYPASSEAIPRIASLWVQTAIRTLHEEAEKVSNS